MPANLTPDILLRLLGTLLLSAAAAFAIDRLTAARGLLPPGFREPWRRLLAGLAMTLVLAIGVFAPIGMLGLDLEQDLSQVNAGQLFQLHMLMVLAMGVWFLLGYAVRPAPAPAPAVLEGEPYAAVQPAPPPSLGRQFLVQFGFQAPDVPREIGLGIALGIGGWLVVLMILLAIAMSLMALGGEELVPQQAPAIVPFIAGLPVWLRVLVSLSAGVVEETFFRGFLQPRVGIVLSTAFFAMAHLSYGQPFMLIGITLLSVLYALIVRWRQSVWAAIAAHALFDAVQLLIVVPMALRVTQGQESAAVLLGLG